MAIEKSESTGRTQPTGRGRCLAHRTGPYCAIQLSPGKPKQSGIVNSQGHRSRDYLALTRDDLDDEARHAIISRVENLLKSGFPNARFERFSQSPREQIALTGTLGYRCKGVGKHLNGREISDHYRLLLTPRCVNATKFESLRELVSVFTDYVEMIYDLFKAGYYHRDISERNLIIVDDGGLENPQHDDVVSHEGTQGDVMDPHNSASGSCASEPRDKCPERPENSVETESDGSEFQDDMKVRKPRTGYIIEFDCAAEANHEKSAMTFVKGTLPFVALEMLENNGCEHKYYYDLESLFYVLVWVCLLQDGPRKQGHYPESNYKYEGSVLEGWIVGWNTPEDCQRTAFQRIGNIKMATVIDYDKFARDILNRLPDYFRPIEDLLNELRRILFKASDGDEDPDTPDDFLPIYRRKNKNRVFRRYINALRKARDQLPLTDVDLWTSAGCAETRPVSAAAAKCREFLDAVAKEERSDGDDSKNRRTEVDAGDVFGQPVAPLDGKGKSSAGNSGPRSRKRAAPDETSSSKRPCR